MARAIIRLLLRAHYIQFTRVETDKVKYDSEIVIKDLARLVMSRIISLQYALRKFSTQRRHTPMKKVISSGVNKKYKGIGQTDTYTGIMKVGSKLKQILVNQEVWSDIHAKQKKKKRKTT